MKSWKELARKNILYTYKHNQVISEKIFLKEDQEKKIKCFRNGATIQVGLSREKSGLVLTNNSKKIRLLEEGMIFRLVPSKTVVYSKKKKKPYSPKDRINFYLSTYGGVKGSIRIAEIGAKVSMQRLRNKLKQKQSTVDLKEKEGITFRVEKLTEKTLSLTCLDYGGIYDYYLNNETARLPPQVPENYYATAYFAMNCKLLSSQDKELEKAGELAAQFARAHIEYNYSNFVFQHTEFKYGPLQEYFGQKEEVEHVFSDYEPVNVYAMRVWNSILKNDTRAAHKFLNFVEENQLQDGFIQDNFYPFYKGSKDTTYHQYALACLARAHSLTKDKSLKSRIYTILKRGVEFSAFVQISSGELSYYGRGANNIYHLASTIYAFAYYSKISKKTEYGIYAQKAFDYLKKSFDKKGWSPTAINNNSIDLMGWNHCEMPYNMQTSYFLLRATEVLKKLSLETPQKDTFKLLESGFFKFKNSTYELVITNGGEQLSWAAGRHATGVSGIANLLVKGKSKTLVLDYLDNDVPITDMPRIKVNSKFLPVKPTSISAKDNVVVLTQNYGSILITRIYTLKKRSLEMRTIVSLDKQRNMVQIKGLNNVPLKQGANLKILGKTKSLKVISNPKGTGTLERSGFYTFNSVKSKQEIEEAMVLKFA